MKEKLNCIISKEFNELRISIQNSKVYFYASLASAVDTLEQQESCCLSDINITGNGSDWEAEVYWDSNIWKEKKHIYRFSDNKLEHWIELKGKGNISDLTFLSGTVEGNECGSIPGFGAVYTGCPNFIEKPFIHPADYAANSVGNVTELWGSALNGGPLFYAFGEVAQKGWIGAGLHVKPGEYNFQTFAWNKKRCNAMKTCDNIVGTQSMSLEYFGHACVDGKWVSPKLVFFAAQTPENCLNFYCDSLFKAGLVPEYNAKTYDWWREPIFCTWHEQVALGQLAASGEIKGKDQQESGNIYFDQCNQENLTHWLNILETNNVIPGTIFIDATWQNNLSGNYVDKKKFPDLRAFIDERHCKGQRVILWMKAWETEKLPESWCILRNGKHLLADPTHPEYRTFVKEVLARMLGDGPDCYNGDGLKIDGTNILPKGHDLKNHGNKFGFELLHDYLKLLYDGAKSVKEDALVSIYSANPYFNDCCDMLRVGDLYTFRGDPLSTLEWRKTFFNAAFPDKPIDTDGCLRFSMLDDTRKILEKQAEVGIPCIYQAENLVQMRAFATNRFRKLQKNDYEAIAETWANYRQHNLKNH